MCENNDGTWWHLFSPFLVFCCLTTHERPINNGFYSRLNNTIFFIWAAFSQRARFSFVHMKMHPRFAKLGGVFRQKYRKDLFRLRRTDLLGSNPSVRHCRVSNVCYIWSASSGLTWTVGGNFNFSGRFKSDVCFSFIVHLSWLYTLPLSWWHHHKQSATVAFVYFLYFCTGIHDGDWLTHVKMAHHVPISSCTANKKVQVVAVYWLLPSVPPAPVSSFLTRARLLASFCVLLCLHFACWCHQGGDMICSGWTHLSSMRNVIRVPSLLRIYQKVQSRNIRLPSTSLFVSLKLTWQW